MNTNLNRSEASLMPLMPWNQFMRVPADASFRKDVDDRLRAKRQDEETPAWFQQRYPQAPLSWVAYFSLEFMLATLTARPCPRRAYRRTLRLVCASLLRRCGASGRGAHPVAAMIRLMKKQKRRNIR